MIRSPLSYPGGKFKALPLIIPLIPDNIVDWRECFFGGGSVTLGYLQSHKYTAKSITVCELSSEIWGFWEGTKRYAKEAAEIATKMFLDFAPTQIKLNSMAGNEENYKEVENEAIAEGKKLWSYLTTVDCSTLSLAERAARTFLVNRISFSGMGDSGSMSNDQFKNFRVEMTQKMIDIQPVLQPIDIRNVSFQKLFEDTDEEKTFIFLDPPYIAQEKSGLYGRGGDTHHGFPHKELADLCKAEKCKWLMTLDDSVKARKLYRGMVIQPFKIPYTMAGKTADDSLAGEEIFIANYSIGSDESWEDLENIL